MSRHKRSANQNPSQIIHQKWEVQNTDRPPNRHVYLLTLIKDRFTKLTAMRSSLNTAEQYVGLIDMGCRECPDDSSDIRNFNEMMCFLVLSIDYARCRPWLYTNTLHLRKTKMSELRDNRFRALMRETEKERIECGGGCCLCRNIK